MSLLSLCDLLLLCNLYSTWHSARDTSRQKDAASGWLFSVLLDVVCCVSPRLTVSSSFASLCLTSTSVVLCTHHDYSLCTLFAFGSFIRLLNSISLSPSYTLIRVRSVLRTVLLPWRLFRIAHSRFLSFFPLSTPFVHSRRLRFLHRRHPLTMMSRQQKSMMRNGEILVLPDFLLLLFFRESASNHGFHRHNCRPIHQLLRLFRVDCYSCPRFTDDSLFYTFSTHHFLLHTSKRLVGYFWPSQSTKLTLLLHTIKIVIFFSDSLWR